MAAQQPREQQFAEGARSHRALRPSRGDGGDAGLLQGQCPSSWGHSPTTQPLTPGPGSVKRLDNHSSRRLTATEVTMKRPPAFYRRMS